MERDTNAYHMLCHRLWPTPRAVQQQHEEREGRLASIDPDVVTSKLEKAGDVLEDEAERVGLPVIRVVCE